MQRPDLARQIAAYNNGNLIDPMPWQEIVEWIAEFFKICCLRAQANNKYPIARLKQWLAMLKLTYPEAAILFNTIRTLTTINEISTIINRHAKA